MKDILDLHELFTEDYDFRGKNVVALESTIISHGMPYPQNVTTALMVEDEVRRGGGIPLTIGLINGKIKIGMTEDDIKEFGKRNDVMKCSTRDLSYCLANNGWGATTVAATMRIAKLAGIHLFATGGIGGVHREAEKTYDVSADLMEFTHTDVVVICAGPKAILDVPKTLEYLETAGVPVMTYKSKTVPLFYTRNSSYPSPCNIEDDELIYKIVKNNRTLAPGYGALLLNPIPEADSLDEKYIEAEIESAINEMKAAGIEGKKVTPFLLQRITEKTEGKSLKANIALIKNNAYLAGRLSKGIADSFKDER